MKKEITLIKTFDNNEYQIQINIRDWNKLVSDTKAKWENKIFLKDYNENLYFSQIKYEKWKTQYLALEAPKKEFKWFTPEERKNFNKAKEIILEKTKEWRMKKFIIKRENILKQLARDEERFWLETTISKLEEHKILKNKSIIDNLK